jgi:hypothetical protein
MDRPQAIRTTGYDMTDDSEAKSPQEEYDIEYETAASRSMLEKRVPSRLNAIKIEIVEIDKRRSYEPWRFALLVDLVEAVERNAEQLLETMGKDRLPASAWIARNLLELLVWVRYCAASRENAWRFHGDALRDMKGLMDAHGKTCVAMDIVNVAADIAAALRQVASENLGLDQIDGKYLAVAEAAKADGVCLGDRFAPLHRWLSKFAHPTAGLVHGITHQVEGCRQLQAVCTSQGVYYAAQCTLAMEAQLGIPSTL